MLRFIPKPKVPRKKKMEKNLDSSFSCPCVQPCTPFLVSTSASSVSIKRTARWNPNRGPLADRNVCLTIVMDFFSHFTPVKRQGETKPDTRHGGLSHVGAMDFSSYLRRDDICFRYIGTLKIFVSSVGKTCIGFEAYNIQQSTRAIDYYRQVSLPAYYYLSSSYLKNSQNFLALTCDIITLSLPK